MTKARFVAQLLAKRFTVEGRRVGASTGNGTREEGMQLASARGKESAWEETEQFTRLSVLSVGFREKTEEEDGANSKSKSEVIIFAAGRPTKALINSLPKQIDGIPILVSKLSSPGISPQLALNDSDDPQSYRRGGRIACGSSIATATGYPGTMGALVKKKGDDESIYLLSCNHVIAACNQMALEMPILSPAVDDAKPGGELPTPIARLSEMVELRFGDPGSVRPCEEDAALGRLLNPDLVSSWQGDAGGFDTPIEVADLVPGLKVKKFGRSSGLTEGRVYVVVEGSDKIQCQSPAHDFKMPAWFANYAHVVGETRPFATPGDSGSLVVTADGKAAVGIVFSAYGKGEVAQVLPIRHALKALKADLLNEHGL